MLGIATFIVKQRRVVLLLAVLLLLPSAYGFMQTGVNYDLTEYLPHEMPAKQSRDLLENAFGLSSSVLIMVEQYAPWQVHELKRTVEGVAGVNEVRWLDDYYHISIPASFIPDELRQNFLRDGTSVMQVYLSEGPGAPQTVQAVEQIKSLAGPQAVIGGFPAIVRDMDNIIAHEKWLYLIIAIFVIMIVLSLSTSSNLEPLLLLAAVAFSVVYNMGSNYLLGSISYITQSIAAVLQLAVSMDYGIFLIHRFAAEKAKESNLEVAMAQAVAKTGRAITASALTTVAGFSALVFMQFGLGRDLGLVMAKGVVFSALSVLIILPGLLLVCHKYIARSQRRIIMPSFGPLAAWIVSRRRHALIAFLLLLMPAYWLQRETNIFFSLEHGLSTRVQAVADGMRIRDKFGVAEVVHILTEDLGIETERRLVKDLLMISSVQTVQGISQLVDAHIPEMFIPADVVSAFRQGGYGLCTVHLSRGGADVETKQAISDITAVVASLYGQYHIAGDVPLTNDLKTMTQSDLTRVNWISALAVAAIVAMAFGSLGLPVLMVSTIVFAIWLNLSIARIFGGELYFVTYLVLGAIQLGATVDYAILLTSRYRENLLILKPQQAMTLAIEQSGRSILTSSLALTGATVGVSHLSNIHMIGQMCSMLGMGAFVSMITILFILPAILLVSQPVLQKASLRWPQEVEEDEAAMQTA